ncbi:hypothetical protein [Infirmifilum sp.]|uniref:hypothetical protein n=1 Tax=Infirmifilum sp. TaxID=2856575 RepID=UPI003D0BD649
MALDAIANIFDTRISEELQPIDLEDARRRVKEALSELKSIITNAVGALPPVKSGEGARLAYLLL